MAVDTTSSSGALPPTELTRERFVAHHQLMSAALTQTFVDLPPELISVIVSYASLRIELTFLLIHGVKKGSGCSLVCQERRIRTFVHPAVEFCWAFYRPIGQMLDELCVVVLRVVSAITHTYEFGDDGYDIEAELEKWINSDPIHAVPPPPNAASATATTTTTTTTMTTMATTATANDSNSNAAAAAAAGRKLQSRSSSPLCGYVTHSNCYWVPLTELHPTRLLAWKPVAAYFRKKRFWLDPAQAVSDANMRGDEDEPYSDADGDADDHDHNHNHDPDDDDDDDDATTS